MTESVLRSPFSVLRRIVEVRSTNNGQRTTDNGPETTASTDRAPLLMAALLAALPFAAHAQQTQAPPPQMATVIVPVVGSVNGQANVRWKTDLELHNDQPGEATVSLMLPAAPGQPAIITTIGPGQSVSFSDVVGEAFGLDGALSPLVVQTLGRRSVLVQATVYGVRGSEVFNPEPIEIHYGSTYFPIRQLTGLTFSSEYRTNIGLANLGERDAELVLALQRIPGRNVAVTRVVVRPNALWHLALQSLFPMIVDGGNFTVVVECASPETYIYASVIENATNTATFIQPSIGPVVGGDQ
jgi:hypothetical protein